MNAERGDEWPGALPDRLKQLDRSGTPLGPPEFDLGAVMRAGERRRWRRNAAGSGVAVAAAGAGLALTAVLAGSAVRMDQGHASAAVVDLAYVQQGDSVRVSAGGVSLGRVMLESARVDAGGRGTVEVRIEEPSHFRLSAADFVWASDGQDRSAATVRETSERGFQWTFDGVSAGELAWTVPGTDELAAVWRVGASPSAEPVRRDQVWYLQRENAVTVYRGREPRARVTAAVRRHPGTVQVQLSAGAPYELRRDDFVWASANGSQHAPVVDPWRLLAVGSGGINTATLDFGDVGAGSLLWAPDGREAVGVWSYEDGGVG